MNPPGTYQDCEITEAWIEKQQDGSALSMCFRLNLPYPDGGSGEVVAQHATSGQFGWSGRAVADLLEVPWPGGLRKIDAVVGRKVTVVVKHKESGGKTYENAYIATGRRGQPATDDEIEAGVAKLEAEAGDDNIPF